jgi:hypothetical protein
MTSTVTRSTISDAIDQIAQAQIQMAGTPLPASTTVFPTWMAERGHPVMKADIKLERITNGWLVTLPGGDRVFADVPEAVCGAISEWVLGACDAYERKGK